MNRREFNKLCLAGIVSLIIPGDSFLTKEPSLYKKNTEKLFARGYKLDLEKLSVVNLKLENSVYIPSKEEIDSYSLQLISMSSSYPELKGKQISEVKFLRAEKNYAMRLEPDRDYAQRYSKQAQISIEHAKKFLDFPELNNSSVEFVVPKSAKDVYLRKETLAVYILAKLTEQTLLNFNVKTKNNYSLNLTVTGNQELDGKFLEDGGLVPFPDKKEISLRPIDKRAIFCSTNSSLESLIETPVVELLHSSFKESLYAKFSKQASEITGCVEDFVNLLQKLCECEEKFEHAVGALWLEQYNKDRNLGFSEAELAQYNLKKEAVDPAYKGMGKVLEHIRKIGLKEARRLYIEDPDKLFAVVEKN